MNPHPTVLVTGSTEGIGKAAVLELARRGFRVFASGRNPDKLARLVDEAQKHGLRLETIVLDVTVAETIAAARERVLAHTDGRGLDVLVNNAGYAEAGPIDALTAGDIRAQFETNVVGMFAVTRAFLPEMVARGAGRVVNVSSIAAHLAIPFFGAYTASKHAVHALSETLRIELADRGVRVSEIEPGWVRTGFTRQALDRVDALDGGETDVVRAMRRARDLERRIHMPMTSPERVACAIADAAGARRPRARYRLPWTTSAALTLIRVAPRPLREWFCRLALRHLGTGRIRRPPRR